MKLTWNCWNLSPSAVNCKRKVFSVANNWDTCSAYIFICDCSWTNFSSCCLIFKSAIWSSSVFCFNCEFKFQKQDEQQLYKYLKDKEPVSILHIQVKHKLQTFCAFCCSEMAYWSANSFSFFLNLRMKNQVDYVESNSIHTSYVLKNHW